MPAVRFALVAPIASWGDRISGGSRPSAEVPTWSALVGLLGAALGLPRGDQRMSALAAHYAPAIEVDSPGEPLRDFHTVQSASEADLRAWRRKHGEARTRAEELSAGDVTSLTVRAYRTGSRFQIWLVPVDPTPVIEPRQLADALNAPRFPLFAGRRSCALSEPPAAVVTAFDPCRVTHWDARLGDIRPIALSRTRHDMLIDAAARRFGDRLEHVGTDAGEL